MIVLTVTARVSTTLARKVRKSVDSPALNEELPSQINLAFCTLVMPDFSLNFKNLPW
jgi:hypothetical protein